jgi:hypothetical protein
MFLLRIGSVSLGSWIGFFRILGLVFFQILGLVFSDWIGYFSRFGYIKSIYCQPEWKAQEPSILS